MTGQNQISTADAFDRIRRLSALGLLAVSVLLAVRAADDVLGPAVDRYRLFLAYAMTIVLIGAVLRIVYWKFFRLRKGARRLAFIADEFVTDTVKRAQSASWIVTLLTLVLLEAGRDNTAAFRDLPASFFLQTATAVMLGVFSVVFFYLNRSHGESESE